MNPGETSVPAWLLDKVFYLGCGFTLHDADEPLDVPFEAGGATGDVNLLDTSDTFELGQVAMADTKVHGLVDVNGELVNVAEGLSDGVLLVWEVDVQTEVDVELAYPGKDAGLLDGVAPLAQAGEAGEHGRVGEEGVGVVEHVGGFIVDLLVGEEQVGVDVGVGSATARVGGHLEELLVDVEADLNGEVEKAGLMSCGIDGHDDG